jgi:hypothetical protein
MDDDYGGHVDWSDIWMRNYRERQLLEQEAERQRQAARRELIRNAERRWASINVRTSTLYGYDSYRFARATDILRATAHISTAVFPDLVDALISELKDMSGRVELIESPHGDLGLSYTKIGLAIEQRRYGMAVYEPIREETALERRYELTRRSLRMARGDFGMGAVALRGQDDHGRLFEIRDAPARALLVACPSTNKPHVLFVPVTMQTAKQARAWTFGLAPEDFEALEIET